MDIDDYLETFLILCLDKATICKHSYFWFQEKPMLASWCDSVDNAEEIFTDTVIGYLPEAKSKIVYYQESRMMVTYGTYAFTENEAKYNLRHCECRPLIRTTDDMDVPTENRNCFSLWVGNICNFTSSYC